MMKVKPTSSHERTESIYIYYTIHTYTYTHTQYILERRHSREPGKIILLGHDNVPTYIHTMCAHVFVTFNFEYCCVCVCVCTAADSDCMYVCMYVRIDFPPNPPPFCVCLCEFI